MKHTLIYLLLFSFSALAQPQGINYQGVARDSVGHPVINQNISLRLSVLDSSVIGSAVYKETQNTLTSGSGLFNVSIGLGNVVSGVFENVPWGAGDKWLKVEMDVTGGSNYVLIGTTPFSSVPYALHSKSSDPKGTSIGDMQYWDGSSWVKLPVGSNGNSLTLCNGVPVWGGCPVTITTNVVSAVTYYSAVSGGSFTNNSGTYILAKGVCYSTTPNSTINDNITTDGIGSGNFSSNISGLLPGTTYYVRAYAARGFDVSYGNQVSFITAPLPLATVITNAISNSSYTTASGGGNVTSDGGLTVTSRGVCWSNSPNPTIAHNNATSGFGTGSFSASLTGLQPNTIYYVRAFATNSSGTAYGNKVSFSTSVLTFPSLTTTAISSISNTTSSSGGNITNDGGEAVTARGVCWSTSPSPTTVNSKTTDGSGTGVYTSSITGLTQNALYYVRAYATNSVGTAYGNQVSFNTTSVLAIGSSYLGGILAYILQPGDPGYDANVPHGLIAAPSDQSIGAQWGCNATSIPGTGSAIGTGVTNTAAIIANCLQVGIAARVCDDLVLNGYNDWFLPSTDELNKLYLNKAAIGSFGTDYYWSSRELNSSSAWRQNFGSGLRDTSNKLYVYYVRAVRAF